MGSLLFSREAMPSGTLYRPSALGERDGLCAEVFGLHDQGIGIDCRGAEIDRFIAHSDCYRARIAVVMPGEVFDLDRDIDSRGSVAEGFRAVFHYHIEAGLRIALEASAA